MTIPPSESRTSVPVFRLLLLVAGAGVGLWLWLAAHGGVVTGAAYAQATLRFLAEAFRPEIAEPFPPIQRFRWRLPLLAPDDSARLAVAKVRLGDAEASGTLVRAEVTTPTLALEPVFDASRPGMIQGQVRSAEGIPIAGAEVRLVALQRADAAEGLDAFAIPGGAGSGDAGPDDADEVLVTDDGTVIIAGGAGPAGVGSPGASHAPAVAHTQQNGSYELGRVEAGLWAVAVLHPEYAATHRSGVLVGPGEAVAGVDFILEPGLSLEGVVREPEGRRLAGARVVVRRSILWDGGSGGRPPRRGEYIVAQTASDADGEFFLANLPRGAADLATRLTGYAPDDRELHLETSVAVAAPGAAATGTPKAATATNKGGAVVKTSASPTAAAAAAPDDMDAQLAAAVVSGDLASTLGAAGSAPVTTEIVLSPAAAIGGMVYGPARRGVAGARVALWRRPEVPAGAGGAATSAQRRAASMAAIPADLANPIGETTSLEGGKFLIGGLYADATYDGIVSVPGLAAGRLVGVRGNTFQNAITLKAGGAVSGSVRVLGTKRPLPGMRVVVQSLDPRWPLRFLAQTDNAGTWRVGDLPEGRYSLAVRSTEWVSSERPPALVKTGETLAGQDFEVYRGIPLGGIVVDARSGSPIAGAKVRARVVGGGSQKLPGGDTVLSGNGGEFRFAALPEGVYRVSATARGYEPPQDEDDYVRVVVSADAPPAPVTVQVTPGGVVRGRVIGATPSVVLRTQVRLVEADGSRSRIRRDQFLAGCGADGEFVIEGVPVSRTSRFVVVADADGVAQARTEPIVLTSERAQAEVTLVLSEGRHLQGRVVDGSKRPLEGVEVLVQPQYYEEIALRRDWRAVTTADGRFEVEGVPDGQARVFARLEGWQTAQQTVNVNEQLSGKLITLTLLPGEHVAGLVVDDRGRPFAGARIWVDTSEPTKECSTNENGEYLLTGTPRGGCTIKASVERETSVGRIGYEFSRRAASPNDERCDFVFPIRAGLRGRIVSDDLGDPIRAFEVELKLDTRDGLGATGTFEFRRTIVSDTGRLDFNFLPAGTGDLTIRAEGHSPFTWKGIQLRSPETIDLGSVTLERAGTVKVVVRSARTGAPVSGVRIEWGPSEGEIGKREPAARTGADGSAVVSQVPPGVGRFVLLHSRYLPTESEVVQIVGGESQTMEMMLEPGAQLSGMITDGSGDPLKNVEVRLLPPGGTEPVLEMTDEGGSYSFEGLPEGRGVLTVETRVRGVLAQAVRVPQLRADVSATENVVLQTDCTVFVALAPPPGVVPDPKSAKLELHLVDAEGRLAGVAPIPIPAATGGGGWQIDNVAAGRYLVAGAVKVASPDWRELPGRLYPVQWTEVGGPFTRVDLEFPMSVVDGRVPAAAAGGGTEEPGPGTEATPSPTPGAGASQAGVVLTQTDHPFTGDARRRDWWTRTVKPDASGNFSFLGMGAGTYELRDAASPARFVPARLRIGPDPELQTIALSPVPTPARRDAQAMQVTWK